MKKIELHSMLEMRGVCNKVVQEYVATVHLQ